jgi:hypothetical protein
MVCYPDPLQAFELLAGIAQHLALPVTGLDQET